MGWISVLFARRVIDFVEGGEARRDALFALIGVDPDGPVDTAQMIPDDAFFELLEHVAEQGLAGRVVPLRVGASMRCDDYGAFGLAFKSAVDLASSYQRVERYGRVVTSIANFRVVAGDGTSFMEVIEGRSGRLGLRLTVELALAAAMSLSREVSRTPFAPLRVHVAHDAPPDRSAHDAHFDAPVRFSAERDALEIRNDVLARPNRLGDESISTFFASHLDDALAELPKDGGLGRRVRAEVSQALSEGVPTLPRLAARLGISGRTLQRRLAESGLAYQDLVEEVRRDLADRLLRRTSYSLAEVAFLTGFAEQSTFSRAFKRWRGVTPRAFRQAAKP